MQKLRIEVIVGTGFTADEWPIADADAQQARIDVTASACRLFGGVTVVSGFGSWINERGEAVTEPSLSFVILAPYNRRTLEDAELFARVARKAFRRECVLLVTTECAVREVRTP